MLKTLLPVAAVCCTLSLFSCSKKGSTTSTPVPTTATYTLDSVFSQLSLKPKIITLDVATGGTFYGNSGTQFVFYPNSFISASGAAITGSVNIEVTDYLLKGDMLFSKMLPISNGDPLISGGEYNIVATQNGAPVFLKPGYIYRANIPPTGGNIDGIKLFTGTVTSDSGVAKVNWVQAQRDSTKYMVNAWVATGSDTINIISDSLQLTNADRFLTSPNYQTFTVTATAIGATINKEIVHGYSLYDQYKGVWPLFSYDTTLHKFIEGHVPNIPVHFVVFTVINGKFYGGTLGVTPASGTTYNVTLTQQDAADFKKILNRL